MSEVRLNSAHLREAPASHFDPNNEYLKSIGMHWSEDTKVWHCPKCGYLSGDAWFQCGGSCPITTSPHHKKDGDQ